jgi:protein CpxP
MAEVLGLNDAQKEQISAVLKSGWEKNAPLRRQMAESRKQLIKATKTTAFDEAAVRAIATNIAQIKTEMIVSRARVQNQIYALLTPEQRDLAEKLHPLMERSVHRPFPR